MSSRVAPFGDPRINGYLLLPEAFRSLSRPSSAPDAKAFPLRSLMPRHSPCALSSLTCSSQSPFGSVSAFQRKLRSLPCSSLFRRKLVFGDEDGGYEFCFELSENSWFSLRIMQAYKDSKLYVTLHPFGCCSTFNLLRHAFA